LDNYSKDKVKIACVSFGYKNGDLIKLLIKRGLAIGNAKFEDIKKIDHDIKKLVGKEKNELIANQKHKMFRPVNCFVTFEDQEGNDRCEKYFF